MIVVPHEHQDDDDDDVDIVRADSFTVDFCEHGYGEIAFWFEGEDRPFAIAYFTPSAVIDLARVFTEAIKPVGNA